MLNLSQTFEETLEPCVGGSEAVFRKIETKEYVGFFMPVECVIACDDVQCETPGCVCLIGFMAILALRYF